MQKTKAHTNVEEALSPSLRDAFNLMVADYKEASILHTPDHSTGVNYNIIAELVKSGWRKTESNKDATESGENHVGEPVESRVARQE